MAEWYRRESQRPSRHETRRRVTLVRILLTPIQLSLPRFFCMVSVVDLLRCVFCFCRVEVPFGIAQSITHV